MHKILILALIAPLAGCVQPGMVFLPSPKSAVELRSVQTRIIDGAPDTVMRGVVATMHDLGYRITKVEAGAGTVSGTRQTALRMAVVVQPYSTEQSVVRANATLVALRREAQVDSAEFYNRNFFVPLGATLHRELSGMPQDATAPDAVRPIAELNSAKERQAAAARVTPNTSASPATGSNTR